MKKILAAILLIFFFTQAKAQTPYTAPWGFNYAAPTAAPSALGTHVRLDISTGRVYQWSPDFVQKAVNAMHNVHGANALGNRWGRAA